MPNMPLHTSRPTNNSNQMLQKYPQMPGIAIIVVNYKQYCVYGEDAMRTICPICQAERGCNETMVLCWLLSWKLPVELLGMNNQWKLFNICKKDVGPLLKFNLQIVI